MLRILFALCVLSAGCKVLQNEEIHCVVEQDFCDSDVALEVCCSITNCYYTFNGTKYTCDGIDCSEASDQVSRDACAMIDTKSN